MKIVSWNCKDRFVGLKHEAILSVYPDVDILVIQECTLSDFEVLRSLWGSRNNHKWYSDCIELGGLGIAVFSKPEIRIECTDAFNRNYRYVMPLSISNNNCSKRNDFWVFYLFAVWTKARKYGGYYDYDENVVMAANAPEYKPLFNKGTILIGDFNTKSNDSDSTHIGYYKKLVSGLSGFRDCAKEPEIHKATFKGLYRNDFCFFSDSMIKRTRNIQFSVNDEWTDVQPENGKLWKEFSDHCPICVEFELTNDNT